MYADDIAVFVSLRLDLMAVKKAVERYEEVAGIFADSLAHCHPCWTENAQ